MEASTFQGTGGCGTYFPFLLLKQSSIAQNVCQGLVHAQWSLLYKLELTGEAVAAASRGLERQAAMSNSLARVGEERWRRRLTFPPQPPPPPPRFSPPAPPGPPLQKKSVVSAKLPANSQVKLLDFTLPPWATQDLRLIHMKPHPESKTFVSE